MGLKREEVEGALLLMGDKIKRNVADEWMEGCTGS